MMENAGRVPDGTGLSRATPLRVDGPTGFDPARMSINVGRHTLGWSALRAGFAAMAPGLGIDYFELHDVEQALLPQCRGRGINATYLAGRLLQRAKAGGYVRHRGRGQWVRCDSDTQPKAGDAKQGSARE